VIAEKASCRARNVASHEFAMAENPWPGFTILDPLSASLLGMFLFREHIQAAVPYLAGEAAALAIVIAGATALSRSQLVVGEDEASPTPPAGYQAHSHRQQAGR
jgi:hypothetical protein